MIGKIKGSLVEVNGNIGLIETRSGIYYEVFLIPHILSKPSQAQVEIYTYLQVKEDDLILFGFESKKQKDLFKLLISVSGVGPKTAFGIISFTSEEDLLNAVRENDINFFSKIPGLGRKTAMKIILEISQKLKSAFQMEKLYLSEDDKTVVDALVSLGFRSVDAKQILLKIPKNRSVEEKIREGLKLASKSG